MQYINALKTIFYNYFNNMYVRVTASVENITEATAQAVST